MSMVEPYSDPHVAPSSALRQACQFAGVAPAGLFDQHVLARINRGTHDLSEQVMRRGHNERFDIRTGYDRPPVRTRGAARYFRRDLSSPRGVRVNAMDQPGTRQVLRATLTNQSTADDCDVQSLCPQLRPRSGGTIRRRV